MILQIYELIQLMEELLSKIFSSPMLEYMLLAKRDKYWKLFVGAISPAFHLSLVDIWEFLYRYVYL